MKGSYAETIVKRETTLATIGLGFLMVVGTLLGLVLLFSSSILSIVGAALIVGSIYFFPRLKVEYEYIFVDGQLDFDKVTGNSKRKAMLRINLDQVEIIAPIKSNALDSYRNLQCEKKNFSSHSKNDKLYVIIAKVDNKMLKIFFEPDERMINTMKQKSPRKVALY